MLWVFRDKTVVERVVLALLMPWCGVVHYPEVWASGTVWEWPALYMRLPSKHKFLWEPLTTAILTVVR